MTQQRLSYQTLSPEAYRGFIATKQALDRCSLDRSSLGHCALDQSLLELVYLRLSQMNGCAFCLAMHAASLRAAGVDEAKLDCLAGWRVSERFDGREKAALGWTESMADIQKDQASDEAFARLQAHFTDAEISDLSCAVALMSALNRLAIAMRQ